MFAKHLSGAGFQIRRIAKQPNHAHVWEAFLKRGSVLAGHERETAKHEISTLFTRLGFACPKREIDVLVRGTSVEVYFIFEKGSPGCLSYYAGREQWRSDPLE
jgi:hypothetical protein